MFGQISVGSIMKKKDETHHTTLSHGASLVRETSLVNKYSFSIPDRYSITLKAQQGVKIKSVFDLVDISDYNKEFFANLLDVSTKTLDRYYAENKTLNPLNSEIVLKLMDLYSKGVEVFGDLASFRRWIEKPSYGLGNIKPVEFFSTSTGIDLVKEELQRIEYGDLS